MSEEITNAVGGSDAVPAVDAISIPAESVISRRSRWLSSLAAFKYVNSISRDDDIKVRDSDRATTIALLVCMVMALICLFYPRFESFRVDAMFAADILVGVALAMYVANRFGIVTTFKPRQALLTWQLMMGSSLFGIFLAVNMAIGLAFIWSSMHIVLPR